MGALTGWQKCSGQKFRDITMTKMTRRKTLALALGLAATPILVSVAKAAGHGGKHTVKIASFKFDSDALEIKVGEMVEFVNEDGAPHTATADDGSFDTGTLGKGDTATITFETAGSFDYFCAVHPHMRGNITVV